MFLLCLELPHFIFLSLSHPLSLGAPRIIPPPPSQDRGKRGGGSGNPLRDFMLRSPDSDTQGPYREPPSDIQPSYESPEFPHTPFHGWTPFSKVNKIFSCTVCVMHVLITNRLFCPTSLMIFGDRGHRKLQMTRLKKTEVGYVFDLS